MFDRERGVRSSRRGHRPVVESLEGRQLLVASLSPIADITVPQTLGFQVPLESGPGAPNQTYTVSTDNGNVGATIARGKFLQINVTHASANATDPAFEGTLTFQLFDDLTPLTTSRIEELVNMGFYTGKNFHRIASGFPGSDDFIVQGGSVNGDGTGDVDLPGFPFQDEFVQQLAFTNPGLLAMANAGRNTNQSQFFVTTADPRFLDYLHTIFGQLTDGEDIVNLMTQVARNSDGTPTSPILITSATLSDQNPDGVLHIDATKATAGVTTNVTVTATDPVSQTSSSQTFQVSVAPNTMNERPFLTLVDPEAVVGTNGTFRLQLHGVDADPGDVLTYTVQGGTTTDTTTGQTTFTPLENATATVTPDGLVTVTPNPNFVGEINVLVGVRDQVTHTPGAPVDAVSNFDYKELTLTVTNQLGGVRVLGTVLTVSPPPTPGVGTNTVSVDQVDDELQVTINGVVNPIRPAAASIDRVVVFGAKIGDNIQVSPGVDPLIPVTLDGGHGGTNVLRAGDGMTRLHGWFGRNTLIGGPSDDALIGGAGKVRFVPSGGNDILFAGTPNRPDHAKTNAPNGTFFRFVGRRLVPVPTPSPHQARRPMGPMTGGPMQGRGPRGSSSGSGGT